jgi:hypothetical protein
MTEIIFVLPNPEPCERGHRKGKMRPVFNLKISLRGESYIQLDGYICFVERNIQSHMKTIQKNGMTFAIQNKTLKLYFYQYYLYRSKILYFNVIYQFY